MVGPKWATKNVPQLGYMLRPLEMLHTVFFWSMPNGILVFILTTSLDKHLVTTSTYLVAQILDSNAEDKIPSLSY